MTEHPYPNSLGSCMAAKGMTDPQLADLAGTTKQQIFKLRRGERKLTVQWAKRLAPHLGLTWYELADDPGTRYDPRRREILVTFDTTDERGRDLLYHLSTSLRQR